MDHPESDRVLARELNTVLTELRDKNKKLTDEKKAAEASRSWGWAIAVLVLFALFLVVCGSDKGHHHHW